MLRNLRNKKGSLEFLNYKLEQTSLFSGEQRKQGGFIIIIIIIIVDLDYQLSFDVGSGAVVTLNVLRYVD